MAETKICHTCGIDKPISNYYTLKKSKDGYFGSCMECLKKKKESYDEFKDLKGTVPITPGIYTNKQQENSTKEFLVLLGWKFDRITKIWYKSPLKNRYGVWKFPRKKKKTTTGKWKGKHVHDIWIKMKLNIEKPPTNYRPKKRLGDRGLSNKQQNEIREQYQQKKITQQKLADKYQVSVSYINCILHYRT